MVVQMVAWKDVSWVDLKAGSLVDQRAAQWVALKAGHWVEGSVGCLVASKAVRLADQLVDPKAVLTADWMV